MRRLRHPAAGEDTAELRGQTAPGRRTRSPFRRQVGDDRGVHVRFMSSETDFMMRFVRLFRVNTADAASDIPGMVDAILAQADGQAIRRLTIEGHGDPGGQWISPDERITASHPELPILGTLREHFTPDAVAVLRGCDLAGGPAGEDLLRTLSELWGIPVHATAAPAVANLPGFVGTSAIATPEGEVDYQASRLDGLVRGKRTNSDRAESLAQRETRDPGFLDNLVLSVRYDFVMDFINVRSTPENRRWLVRLFETASPDDRRELFRHVEHREWDGDFQRGLFARTDALWRRLGPEERSRLQELLDE